MVDTKQRNHIPDRSRPGSTTTAYPIGSLQGGGDKSATGEKPSIKLPTTGTTVGTWNVRTLYQCGKLEELTHELKRYKWDVLGLAEVRWTGFGETTTDEGHKIWYCGEEKHHQHGVAFIVRKEITGSVISCTPVSSRLISIRIAAKPHNMTIIQVYAPTSDHDDEEVEEFYAELDRIIAKVPRKDILVVQGDWNAKIGPDAYQQWAGTVGRYGIGETNDRGLRLLEFAQHHRLTITNTLYPHKLSRRTTWHSPNGQVHNQIDYILTPQRYKSSINRAKTRTYPGADIGSDHDLVLATIKLRLKCQRAQKSHRIRFDLEKLKDPEVEEIFQAQIGGKFAALASLDNDIDTLAGNIKEVLITTADEVLGRRKRKIKPWVTDDILNLCDERRKLRQEKYSSQEAAAQYRLMNRTVRSKMRNAKEKWIEQQCGEIQQGMAAGNSKRAYETLRTLTKTQQPKASVIEDSSGNLLTESTAVQKRWTEYCQKLYNHELQPDTSILSNNTFAERDEEDLPVLQDEVADAVRNLKEGKSPGIDNVPAELLKHGGETVVSIFTKLCQKIWETKQWPKEWTQSLVIPLPKKGNLKQCQNYRTISLISHPSKILLKVILKRLKSKAEELLAEEQAGFRAGRSTTEQIFNSRLIIEKHLQHQRDLFHNFIDFRKAFDRVWHDGLWWVLRSFNVEEGLVRIMEALYENAESAVLLNNEIGEFFRTTVGVRQGCLLSPVLFNLFLEKIMRNTLQDHHTSISVGGRRICNLRFADDIDLLGGSNAELQALTDKLTESAGSYGMEVSTEKSKVMVNSTNDVQAVISMNGEQLEEVDSFTYLGATLTKDGSSRAEILRRIAIATSAMARLARLWKSDTISFPVKHKLYKALVVSILLYGCESWTLLADTERRIQAFEMRCLRKLLRITYLERKTNEYVRDKIKSLVGPQEALLATVKRRKLQWYGHVTRHNSLSKTILQGTLEGGRRRGRQRKNWPENIKEWTSLNTQDLLTAAAQRPVWRRISCSASTLSPRRPARSRD